MPSPKPSHRDKGRFAAKSMSFHGSGSGISGGHGQLRRPKTVPDLFPASMIGGGQVLASPEGLPKLPKLLLNVNIQDSLGAVQVLVKPESTVADLIAAVVRQYVKEGRRPVLPTSDPSGFDLHYSQFSLESLDREEKLMELGSRNFFLCKRNKIDQEISPANSSSKQAEKAAARARFNVLPWLKFAGFLH